MADLVKDLQDEIDRVKAIADLQDINKKVLVKAGMAIKSRNVERMGRYLATLQGIDDQPGVVALDDEEIGDDDDAASDE